VSVVQERRLKDIGDACAQKVKKMNHIRSTNVNAIPIVTNDQ